MVKKQIEKLIKTFAGPVTVYSPVSSPYISHTYGFVQPLRYKNKMYVDTGMTDLGLDDDGRFVYIGLPHHPLTSTAGNGRKMDVGDASYVVIRAENVFFNDKPIYVWAIVKRERSGGHV